MAKINVKITGDDFKGIENFKKNLAKMKQLQARIGVFGGKYPNGESIADVAMLHEFGSVGDRTFKYKGKNINISGVPTRSFLRMPILTKKMKVINSKELIKAYIITSLADGKPEKPLNFMAINAWELVQQAFDTRGFGKWLPNMNKEYIKLKGSTAPLIDTGLLRGSVIHKVVKRGAK